MATSGTPGTQKFSTYFKSSWRIINDRRFYQTEYFLQTEIRVIKIYVILSEMLLEMKYVLFYFIILGCGLNRYII